MQISPPWNSTIRILLQLQALGLECQDIVSLNSGLSFLPFNVFFFVDELVGKWMKMRQNSRSLCLYFTHWLMIWKILERVEIRTWMESRSVPFYWTYLVLHKYMLLKNASGSGMWVSHAGTLGSKSKWPLGLLLMRDAPRQRVASWMELVYFVEAEIGLRNQPTNLNGEPVFWHKNMYIHTYNIYIYVCIHGRFQTYTYRKDLGVSLCLTWASWLNWLRFWTKWQPLRPLLPCRTPAAGRRLSMCCARQRPHRTRTQPQGYSWQSTGAVGVVGV